MKQVYPRVIGTLLLFVLAAVSGGAQGADHLPKPARGEILVASGSTLDDSSAPVTLLIAALKSHPTARRFRVTWPYNVFRYFSSQVAIYDHSTGNIAVFSTGNHNTYSHFMFTGVKESLFPKILADHKNDPEGNVLGYLDNLDRYGHRRYDLAKPHKTQRHSQRQRKADIPAAVSPPPPTSRAMSCRALSKR